MSNLNVSNTESMAKGNSKLNLTEYQLQVVEILEIDLSVFTNKASTPNLFELWKRYNVIHDARSKLSESSLVWGEVTRPATTGLTEFFISKSQWHKWASIFEKVAKFEDMVNWLNEDQDAMETSELWDLDVEKKDVQYTLGDLKTWADGQAQESEKQASKKGKKAEKPKAKKSVPALKK